jgi:hypothetical protein
MMMTAANLTITTAKSMPRTAPKLQLLNQRMMISKLPPSTLLSYTLFLPSLNSIEITPPPTPSPTKAAGGKKRAIANCDSDDDDAFVPRYGISYIPIFFCSDGILTLVLHETVLKRPELKSLPLLQRFQSLSLIRLGKYLF